MKTSFTWVHKTHSVCLSVHPFWSWSAQQSVTIIIIVTLSLPSSHLGVRSLLFSFIYFFLTGFNCFCPHADDTFQIQDWLRSNGNHDRGYPEFDYHHRIRPLSPVKRHRISTITDGRVPDRRRQLKSMESLLGLSDENLNGKHLVRDIEVQYRILYYYVTIIQRVEQIW